MPYTYSSIFDGPTIITKKDLCDILNLDTSRPNLSFTATEINKAYKKRARRFHPDIQNQCNPKLPTQVCNGLMDDIAKARNYMLAGEENIPGKAFKEKQYSFESKNIIDTIISTLNSLKEESDTITSAISWLSFFSNSLLVLIPLSTYSDGQLNLRYINSFAKELAAIRPYLEHIDGSSLVQLLQSIRDNTANEKKLDAVEFSAQIKQISPDLLDAIIQQDKLDALVKAINEAGLSLHNILTDEFIYNLQHIISFWPRLIANTPSWKQIIGVYFISALFTATSLPKFFNSIKVISEVIITHKGIVPFIASILPLLAASLLILPVNLAIQLSLPVTWIALKAAYNSVSYGLLVLSSILNILSLLISDSNKSFAHEAFSLFEGSFNLLIRLTLNTTLELLDSLLFILSNKNWLSDLEEDANHTFDNMLSYFRPQVIEEDINTPLQNDTQLVIVNKVNEAKPNQKNQKPDQGLSFFANAKLHNDEDIWFNNILCNIADAEHNDSDATHTMMQIPAFQ